jgi:hypothetical protein
LNLRVALIPNLPIGVLTPGEKEADVLPLRSQLAETGSFGGEYVLMIVIPLLVNLFLVHLYPFVIAPAEAGAITKQRLKLRIKLIEQLFNTHIDRVMINFSDFQNGVLSTLSQ